MKKSWIKIIVAVLCACLFLKYSDRIFDWAKILIEAAKPLLYGFVVAYILNILMERLEKLYFPKRTDGWVIKTRRPVCVLASIFLVLLVAVLLLVLVAPALGESVYVLTKDIPRAFVRFQKWLSSMAAEAGFSNIQEYVNGLNINWDEIYNKLGSILQKGIGSVFTSAFSVANLMVSFIVTGAVAIIFAVYMLFQKENLRRQFAKLTRAYLPRKHQEQTRDFLALANDTFSNFISGQVLEAFILGALCCGGMFLLRLPYAVMVGAIVGVTALIPVMGCYIGAAVGAFLIVTVSPLKALIFLVFLVILQQVEGNLIYPRVVGGSVGLPGIWVLAAVTIGGAVFGVAGMLVGVPLAATLYKWLRLDVNRRLETGETNILQKMVDKENAGC